MRRLFAVALLLAAPLVITTAAAAHELDHPAPAFTAPAPVGTGLNSSPAGAWQLLTTLATGNPHTDLDFFEQDDEMYASVGTLAAGPNGAGQTIVRLTENGQINALTPRFISGHPSAECASNPGSALGLQHDVEATPKGDVIFNTSYPNAITGEPQLLLDASDARGRCHDQGAGGLAQVPRGGLELIDITRIGTLDNSEEQTFCPLTQTLPASSELRCAVEIGLTSHIGEAHTVNIDPKRPHIAYAVTSDAVTVNPAGTRLNEVPGSADRFDLDGFEVVDLSSCMNFTPGTDVAMKRLSCQPEVYRYRYPSVDVSLGHTRQDAVSGCHELEIYPNDLLTCGSGAALIAFDMSGAFDDNGTPDDFTDDTPNGTPLPCTRRASSSTVTPTGAMVADCVNGTGPGTEDLDVPTWINYHGSPSLEGVQYLGSVYHQGRGGPFNSNEDIDFNHEAELSASGRLLLATDERGGGVVPPGASCAPGLNDVPPFDFGNGGVHFYRVDGLSTTRPADAEDAWEAYARTPSGDKAIYRAQIHTGPQGSLCTAHVFQQIPGQNRIFMGWYTQGTHVIDFVEHPNGTVSFKEAGFFIPENANTWTSAIFKMQENSNGTFTYWGATGDFNLGAAGRSAIDIYKVTLSKPPRPFGQGGAAGDRTTGGGWLLDNAGKKINFGFNAKETASGALEGNLQLNDKAGNAKIHLNQVDSLGPVAPLCGSVMEGPSSLQFTGSGTFNGNPATFRVCVRDGGEGPSAAPDLFYLECTFDCTYKTGAPRMDDAIDSGNIQVRRSTTVTSGAPTATTLILDPVLLSDGIAGQTQLLTVRAYDQYQEPLAGASVTLTKTTADGSVERLTALTGATGTATTLITNVVGTVEYTASVGGVQSNAVEIVSAVG